MDYRSLVDKLEAIERGDIVNEATAPSTFTPNYFHKGNLGNKLPVMQAPDGSWWWEGGQQTGEGPIGGSRIVPWNGNTENRSGWNPASIDGAITPDGKYIDFPEGVSWKQYKEKQDADSRAALLAKLKQLLELVDKYLALKAKRSGQGGKPVLTPKTQNMGDGSKLTTDAKGNVAATDDEGNPYIPGSNPNLPKNKVKESISKSLMESFGYEAQVDEVAVPAGVASVGGAATRALGRAAPGVGAVLGAQGAYDSYKKGDYLGAALNGLSGAFSLVPGLGWVPALGFGMWQAGRELSGATDKYDNPQGQGGRSGGNADPKVLAIQKKILAKDPKALPQHGADGIMGPETQAAMARLKIQESTEMKSLAESMKDLQDRLTMIETEIVNEADVQPEPATGEENALAKQLEQAGGKLMEKDRRQFIVLPEKGLAVEVPSLEVVDASTPALAGTGKTFNPTEYGLSEDLDEGIWSNIVKGLAQGFKNPNVVKNVSKVKPGGIPGYLAARTGAGAKGAANAIKANPGKAALGIGGAALASGYATGKPSSTTTPATTTPQTGSQGNTGQSGQGGNPVAPQEDDEEMKALRAQIDALVKELSTSQDPEIQKGLANVQAKLK